MNVENSHRIIDLPIIKDFRGSLGFVESDAHVPFLFRRIFYLYDVIPNQKRGAHAHRECQQFLIALRGSFIIEIDTGKNISTVSLKSPSRGVYIPPMHWLDLSNFSADAICLVLASDPYDEADYIRDYSEFKREVT